MVWPSSVSTDSDLYVAVNNLSTTLNGAIDAVTTTVVLTSASAFPATGGYVTIGTEAIKYTSKTGNSLNGVTRGADGTTAASHADLSLVFLFYVADHHNVLKEEIKSLETSLDLTANRAVITNGSGRVATGSVTSTEIGYLSGATSALQTQLNTLSTKVNGTGLRNKLLNGDINLSQRGTTFSNIQDNQYLCDRFKFQKASTSATLDASQDSDVPTVAESSHKSSYSLKLDCTTADAVIGAADVAFFHNLVEGYDYAKFAQKDITLSFWIKGNKTGIHCVSLRNSTSDRSYVAEYTINATATWEKKVINIPAPPSAGTWDYLNGIGLSVSWTLLAGTDYQTTAGSWQSGYYVATANQVNVCDSASNNLWITQVQLEVGSSETEFESLPIEVEVSRCQRYYEKSYNLTTALGTVTDVGAVTYSTGTTDATDKVSFLTRKRSAPTIVVYSTATGASGQLYRRTVAADVTAASSTFIGETGFGQTTSSSANSTGWFSYHFTADAEL